MFGLKLFLYNVINKILEKVDEINNYCEGGNCEEG